MGALILDRFGEPLPPSNSGPVVLAPRPVKLSFNPGFIDREENHIANEAFIRECFQHAQELNEGEHRVFRANFRTANAERKAWLELPLEKRRQLRALGYEPPLVAVGGGAAGSWTLTNGFRTSLIGGTNPAVPATDSCKIALFQSTSNLGAASTTYAGLTNEVGTTNTGYSTGGVATTIGYSGTTSVPITFTQAQWTAGTAGLTARFGVLYKVAGVVYGYFLCDSTPADVTASNGNTFTVSAGTWLTVA